MCVMATNTTYLIIYQKRPTWFLVLVDTILHLCNYVLDGAKFQQIPISDRLTVSSLWNRLVCNLRLFPFYSKITLILINMTGVSLCQFASCKYVRVSVSVVSMCACLCQLWVCAGVCVSCAYVRVSVSVVSMCGCLCQFASCEYVRVSVFQFVEDRFRAIAMDCTTQAKILEASSKILKIANK